MNYKVTKKSIILITVILLTTGNSSALISKGVNSYVEYFAYFLLIVEVWLCYLNQFTRTTVKDILLKFIPVIFFFSIGLILQDMPNGTKLRLIFTMFAIATTMLPAEKYLNGFVYIRSASYGIFVGTIITTLLALATHVSLWEYSHEGFLNYGFTGGIQYKNYYAAAVIASFMGLFLYNKYEKIRKMDLIVMGVEILLIFISNSRGGYLILFAFLIFSNIDLLKYIRKKDRAIFLLIVITVMVLVAYQLYIAIAFNSGTYMYRIRGVLNYLTYCDGDVFKLLFGDAAMAFKDGSARYVWTIRANVGADGSYEMGFINVLIKNGIIGIIGYAFVYFHFIKTIIKEKAWKYKVPNIAILCTLLVSSLVESYVCSIHAIFGVYCYLVMAGICGIVKEKNSKHLENYL